jgi:hypothetical protein
MIASPTPFVLLESFVRVPTLYVSQDLKTFHEGAGQNPEIS